MRIPQPVTDEATKKDLPSFGGLLDQTKQPKMAASYDVASLGAPSSFSGGGLPAPDGYTRDPFPPSLVAYIEIIRSIAAYLREQGMISGGEQKTMPTAVAPPTDVNDVDEPTTFAIGEEEHDCGAPAGTPAIGETALA